MYLVLPTACDQSQTRTPCARAQREQEDSMQTTLHNLVLVSCMELQNFTYSRFEDACLNTYCATVYRLKPVLLLHSGLILDAVIALLPLQTKLRILSSLTATVGFAMSSVTFAEGDVRRSVPVSVISSAAITENVTLTVTVVPSVYMMLVPQTFVFDAGTQMQVS